MSSRPKALLGDHKSVARCWKNMRTFEETNFVHDTLNRLWQRIRCQKVSFYFKTPLFDRYLCKALYLVFFSSLYSQCFIGMWGLHSLKVKHILPKCHLGTFQLACTMQDFGSQLANVMTSQYRGIFSTKAALILTVTLVQMNKALFQLSSEISCICGRPHISSSVRHLHCFRYCFWSMQYRRCSFHRTVIARVWNWDKGSRLRSTSLLVRIHPLLHTCTLIQRWHTRWKQYSIDIFANASCRQENAVKFTYLK